MLLGTVLLHPQAPSFAFADYVGMNVEVPEEEQEGHHVQDQRVMHPQGEVTADADSIDSHDQSYYKLDQLHDGQVLLPPQVLGDPRGVYRRQAVVGVHNNVHE